MQSESLLEGLEEPIATSAIAERSSIVVAV
jgi:hypothetical protein